MSILLVTGGSRGIGAAISESAAESGYEVCVNFRENSDAAERVVASIRRKGGRAIALQGDVSKEQDVVGIFEKIDRDLGRVGGLVNNAGIVAKQARFDTFTAERIETLFRVNVFGAFFCAREAVKRMSSKNGGGGGSIVNVSSAASRLGSPGEYVDYAASKGAIDTMTLGLAREVAAEGIRVNAVRPGFINTEIHADGGEPGRIDRIRSSIPLGRGGDPGEVAATVIWLLSSQSSYTTGAIVDISGGR